MIKPIRESNIQDCIVLKWEKDLVVGCEELKAGARAFLQKFEDKPTQKWMFDSGFIKNKEDFTRFNVNVLN